MIVALAAGLACGCSWSGAAGPAAPVPPRVDTGDDARAAVRTVDGSRDSLADFTVRLAPVLVCLDRAARFPAGERGRRSPAAPVIERLRRALDTTTEPRELWARFELDSVPAGAGAGTLARVRLLFARRLPGAEALRLRVHLLGAPDATGGAPALRQVVLAWSPADLVIELGAGVGAPTQKVRLRDEAPYRVVAPEVGDMMRDLERNLYRPLVAALSAAGGADPRPGETSGEDERSDGQGDETVTPDG
jgi:hypothetical protein